MFVHFAVSVCTVRYLVLYKVDGRIPGSKFWYSTQIVFGHACAPSGVALYPSCWCNAGYNTERYTLTLVDCLPVLETDYFVHSNLHDTTVRQHRHTFNQPQHPFVSTLLDCRVD